MRNILCMFLMLMFSSAVALAQNTKTITGKVLDKNGKAVEGASVHVKGTEKGTTTGSDGTFSISVSSGTILTIDALNFASQDLTVGSDNDYTVTMSQQDNVINEVVVTALGVKKEQKAIGYSVSTVKADELVKSGETNIIEGLAAKATGVQVTSSSGTPGASSKIVLRGPATFSGDNQPLIVIDGVPMDNSVNNVNPADNPYNNALSGVQVANRALDIAPEDIESVSILKGPAAAAIYGQAAGNGAIIYTTKKGAARRGIGVSYSGNVEIQNVSKLPGIQMRYGQGNNGSYSNTTPNSWGEDLVKAGKPIYDNIDNFFQTGTTFNNNISLNGGSDKTTFRMSVNSTNMKGIVPNSKLNRYSARITGDSKLSNWLTVGGTANYSNTQSTLVQNGSNLAGVMLALLRMPVDFDGRNYINPDGTQITFYGAYDNPFFSVRMNPYTDETDRFLGNVYADAKLSKTFSLSWKVGSDFYNTDSRQIYAWSSLGNDNADGTGQVNKIHVGYRNLYSDLLLKFKTSFGADKNFGLNGMIGANYNYKQYQSLFARGRGLSIPGFYGLSGLSELYASDAESYQNSKALFADLTFDYKSTVFLTLTGRNEWSTTFGKNAKGFFYPKADLSYVFSSLFKDSKVVNYGKVRVAYANVGISPTVYTDRTYYTVPNIADGYTGGLSFPYMEQNGYAISNTLYGFDLKPERNIGLEAGLEMKFFKNRIGLDLTLYQQKSKDLLIGQPIAPTSGFQYKYVNIGEIRNRGIEVGLSGDVIKSKDFLWNIVVNWSKNVNEVLQLAPGIPELPVGSAFTTPQSFAIVGEPFGVLYGTKFQRDANGNMLILSGSGLPAQETTNQNIGNPLPEWLANINNSFTYKNWNFSFLWDIRHGGTVWNGTWSNLNFRGKSAESGDRERTYVIDGVYADGPNKGQKNTTAISATSYYQNYLGNTGSEVAMQDGGWVRLRSVALSYRFSFNKKAIQYIELGAGLRNVILITDYKGIDPETSLTGASQNFNGYDYYNNPGTKSYLFNLKIGL
ncbi:SusC/RagA family TonB-linked outer membrane protein [Danxiaibacter flavus]|uniref:SusC/RagA family TonB-linked outer membrane protein n=1 Tax=Danxiaibacter flavus TaxID=3049108 RepID=A0ABV3ZCT6_9BACT|nr:SusC/RagA family TonB-linked outer membrane protein [Chitinophagaceae bacterium DXS]